MGVLPRLASRRKRVIKGKKRHHSDDHGILFVIHKKNKGTVTVLPLVEIEGATNNNKNNVCV